MKLSIYNPASTGSIVRAKDKPCSFIRTGSGATLGVDDSQPDMHAAILFHSLGKAYQFGFTPDEAEDIGRQLIGRANLARQSGASLLSARASRVERYSSYVPVSTLNQKSIS